MNSCWWLSLALSALLPVSAAPLPALTQTGGKHAGSLLRRRGAAKSDSDEASFDEPPPACSCDCCDVVDRSPNEVSFGLAVKCSPSTVHSEDMCGMQCSTSEKDRLLQEEVVDAQRFCFFECKAAAGPNAPEKSQCVALEENEASELVDPAGNPIDPAFLFAPQLQHPFSSQQPASYYSNQPMYSAAGAAANLLSSRTRLAKAYPGSAQTEAKDARSEAAKLREMENVKQQALNSALKQSGDAGAADPMATIQDVNTAAMKAKVSAEKAAATAAKAVESYDQGRKKIWKMALSEAGRQATSWATSAEAQAAAAAKARAEPTWQSRAVQTAQKASKPYVDGMLRAQDSAKAYNQQALALASQATALWKESHLEADHASQLPRASSEEANAAEAVLLDAREKAKEAQSMAAQSKQYFAVAAEVQNGIPAYVSNGQQAASVAVAGMNAPQ